MTSLGLLLWMVHGIALQVGVFLGISFWRHWQSYNQIKHGQPRQSDRYSYFRPLNFSVA